MGCELRLVSATSGGRKRHPRREKTDKGAVKREKEGERGRVRGEEGERGRDREGEKEKYIDG